MTTTRTSRTSRPRGPVATAAALALAASLLLGACGDSDDAAKGTGDPTEQVDPGAPGTDDVAGDLDSTAPEACHDRFPLALEPASLDELTHLPDGWPEGPEGSTLCTAQGSIDGSVESAGYVTERTPEEVISHYAEQLGPEFGAVEEEGAFGGPALVGTIGTTGWQVETRTDGTFQLGFGES